MDKNVVLHNDILRYKKNKFAARFALGALVFNCLYFCLLYSIHDSKDMFDVRIGISVIVNLVVLLMGFYASEGIKSYEKKFSIHLLVLAAVQLLRIIYYPATGLAKNWLVGNYYFGIKMNNAANGALMIIYLVASAAFFIVAAVQGYIVAKRLENFRNQVESGEVSVDAALAELDAEDNAKAAAAASNEEVATCLK